MHYYKRNIGDYAKKAGRLSMLEHGAYTLLMDAIYDRESFPTMAQAIEWTWASTGAEVEAVEFVLGRFFTLDGDHYTQKRIVEELADFKLRSTTNKRIAIERETKRKESTTNREPVVHEPPPNQEPLTTNHEPVKKKRKHFKPPTHDEVLDYANEKQLLVNPGAFIDFYESKDWMVGKNKMKSWQAAMRTWSRREEDRNETDRKPTAGRPESNHARVMRTVQSAIKS